MLDVTHSLGDLGIPILYGEGEKMQVVDDAELVIGLVGRIGVNTAEVASG